MMFRVDANPHINPQSRLLLDHASDVYSQFGEDGVIREIFSRIGPKTLWCCEIGAGNGRDLSNARNLIEHGWFAVMIECNRRKADELRRYYEDNKNVTCVQSRISVDGLDEALSKTDIPDTFDFLCIDIDGCDWHMWNRMKRYRARVVMIEFNPTIANNVYFVQEPDPNMMIGASLRALVELGKGKRYELVGSTGFNAFFVDASEFSALGIADNSIDALHDDSPFVPVVFQSYEGKMISARTPKIWETSYG